MKPSILVLAIILVLSIQVSAQSMIYYNQPQPTRQLTMVQQNVQVKDENETGTFTIISKPSMVTTNAYEDDSLKLNCPYEPAGLAIEGIIMPGPSLPSQPYDFDEGDCDMLGNEDKIAAYVQELKEIAEACKNAAIEKYPEVLEDKDDLDGAIDDLPPPSPESEFLIKPTMPIRGFSDSSEGIDLEDHDFDENYIYTNYLESLREAALGVCQQKDRVKDVLVEKCFDINFDLKYYDKYYGGVPDTAKDSFHSRLSYVPGMSLMAKNESVRRYNEWFMLVFNNFNESLDYGLVRGRCGGNTVLVKNIPSAQDLNYLIRAEVRRDGDRFLIRSNASNKYSPLTVSGDVVVESRAEVNLSSGRLEIEVEGKKFQVKYGPARVLDLTLGNNTVKIENIILLVMENQAAYEVEEVKTVKLFGFIPVRARVKTVVSAESLKLISENKSWWMFLSSND